MVGDLVSEDKAAEAAHVTFTSADSFFTVPF
jgi:hypothetical protein